MTRHQQIVFMARVLCVEPVRMANIYRFACEGGLIATPPRGIHCPLLSRQEVLLLIVRVMAVELSVFRGRVRRPCVVSRFDRAETDGIEMVSRRGAITELAVVSAQDVSVCLATCNPPPQDCISGGAA